MIDFTKKTELTKANSVFFVPLFFPMKDETVIPNRKGNELLSGR